MKIKIIYMCVLLGVALGINAQTITPQTLPTQGGTMKSVHSIINYTLGQDFSTVLTGGINIITVGELQPELGLPGKLVSQTACSDTTHNFTFSNIFAGAGGNQVEWATNSGFSNPHFFPSGDSFAIAVAVNADSSIWVRSRDSVSGWISGSINVHAIVKQAPDSFIALVQSPSICLGAATNIFVLSSQTGIKYKLFTGGNFLSYGFGNSDTLNLSTGPLGASSTFKVVATDTTTGCRVQSANVSVSVAMPAFTSGDTVLCKGDSCCYVAVSPDSGSIFYSIYYGNVLIDSVSGCVSQVGGNFTVMATANDSGCATMSAFRNVVVPIIGTPDIMPFQNACSDTAVTFNFSNGQMSGNANKIMWAADSAFTSPQSSNSLSAIHFSVGPGADTTLWLMSLDSISGCVSTAFKSGAAVNALPDSFIAYLIDTLVCPGTVDSINITSTQTSVRYTISVDTGVVSGALGNGGTLELVTGAVNATAFYSITGTDTLTGCARQIWPGLKVKVVPTVNAPVFPLADTLACGSTTACYTATSANAGSIMYNILSGGASIDSVTGCVSSITSGFKIKATATDSLGCSVAIDSIHVSFDSILPPVLPLSQTIHSDTPYTFNFIISAGCGGNQVQWSLDSTFSTSHTGTSPDTIGLTVDTASVAILWVKTKDSITNNTSKEVSIKVKNLSPPSPSGTNWAIYKVGFMPSYGVQNPDVLCSENWVADNTSSQADGGLDCDPPGDLTTEWLHSDYYGTIERYYTCETGYVMPDVIFPRNCTGATVVPLQNLCVDAVDDQDANTTVPACNQIVKAWHLTFFAYDKTTNIDGGIPEGSTIGSPIVVTYPADYTGTFAGDVVTTEPTPIRFYFQSNDPSATVTLSTATTPPTPSTSTVNTNIANGIVVPYVAFPSTQLYALTDITYDWVSPNSTSGNPYIYTEQYYYQGEVDEGGEYYSFCKIPLYVVATPKLDFKITNPSCGNEFCFTVTNADGSVINANTELGGTFLGNSTTVLNPGPNFAFDPNAGGFYNSQNLCASCSTSVCPIVFSSGLHTVTLNESPYAFNQTSIGMPLDDIECGVTKTFTAPTSSAVLTVQPNPVIGCNTEATLFLKASETGGTQGGYYTWGAAPGVTAGYAIFQDNFAAKFVPSESENGTYTVTYTDTFGCSTSAPYTVDLSNCCQGSLTLNNESVSHLIGSPAITYNGDGSYSLNVLNYTSTAINGSFIIDEPLVIQGDGLYTIDMGANSEIDVPSGNTLVLSRVRLAACTDMWQGIKIYGGNGFNGGHMDGFSLAIDGDPLVDEESLYLDGVHIYDAVVAVSALDGSYYNITGSYFYDNLTGIAVNPYPYSGSFKGSIKVTTLAGSNPTLKPPYNNVHAQYGMSIENCSSISISRLPLPGEIGSPANTFTNLRTGILAYSSNVTVYPNYFLNMVTPANAVSGDGTGIVAIGSFFPSGFATNYGINVYGFDPDPTTNMTPNFVNMQTGISLSQMQADIEGNYFENVGATALPPNHFNFTTFATGYGVIAQNCNSGQLRISNNVMNPVRAGIYLIQNPNAGIIIYNNYLTVSHHPLVSHSAGVVDGTGISISQTVGATRYYSALINNHINNYVIGISLNNAQDLLTITGNQLNMNSGYLQGEVGLQAINSNNAQIGLNTFTGTVASAGLGFSSLNQIRGLRTGVLMQNSPYCAINCNTFDNTSFGMHFKQTNVSLDDFGVRGNNFFDYHYTGIYFDGAGLDARVGNIGQAIYSADNKFLQPTGPQTNYISGNQTVSSNRILPPGQIFYFVADGGNSDAPIGSPEALTSIKLLSGTDYDCSSGTYPRTRVGIRRYIADVLDGSALTGVRETYLPTASYEAKKFVFAAIDSFPDLLDSANIDSFYKVTEGGIIDNISSLYGYVAQLSDSLTYSDSSAYAAALSTALSYDTSITSIDNYDYNDKMIMKAYLTTVAAGKNLTTDSPSTAFVSWLAHQCPYIEGNSVYRARGLYAMINPDEVYNDDSLCPPSYDTRMLMITPDSTNTAVVDTEMGTYGMHLQPNPANNYTVVYYNIPASQQATLNIYDQLGQLVLRQKLVGTANSANLYTNSLQDGVYNYQFILHQRLIKRDKFVVVH